MEQKTGLHIWTGRKRKQKMESSHTSHRLHRKNILLPEVGKSVHCLFYNLQSPHQNTTNYYFCFGVEGQHNFQELPVTGCRKASVLFPSAANWPISLPHSSTKRTYCFGLYSHFKYANHSKFAQLEQQSQKLQNFLLHTKVILLSSSTKCI